MNIIEATESSRTSESNRTDSLYENFNIHDNYSTRSNYLLDKDGKLASDRAADQGMSANLDDLNSKKFASHSQSYKSMFHCGLLSNETLRKIHSDIVTVEALSSLECSQV